MVVNEQKRDDYVFPKDYDFPPFFTRQPTALTRQAQLKKWSAFIRDYCRHHKIFQLSLVDLEDNPLFYNARLNKKLAIKDMVEVVDHMASKEGDERAEWLSATKSAAWIWWRKPEEWGNLIAGWVDETGQKGSVLTLYEIVQGEATESQEFHGMDMEVLHKSLNVLAKKGSAQVFGTEDQQGVKFF